MVFQVSVGSISADHVALGLVMETKFDRGHADGIFGMSYSSSRHPNWFHAAMRQRVVPSDKFAVWLNPLDHENLQGELHVGQVDGSRFYGRLTCSLLLPPTEYSIGWVVRAHSVSLGDSVISTSSEVSFDTASNIISGPFRLINVILQVRRVHF